MSFRLRLIDLSASKATQPMCDAVFSGLSNAERTLPCRFFYDQLGSELFEQITELPEYYLTRCEGEILRDCAELIVEAAGGDLTIIEFGSGSSTKTRHLLSAALKRQDELHYIPIDISRDFLRQTADELLFAYPMLSVTAISAEYLDAIAHLPKFPGPRLFVFLGSNIGNFARDEAVRFLQNLCQIMNPEDRLLLGTDLVKDRDILHKAYNDASGITAKFNLNLLKRINEELGANFDLNQYSHHAPFDEVHSRIEMRLISRRDQAVRIEDLETTFEFSAGEVIQTEWSHKYTEESVQELADDAGLRIVTQWLDCRSYFAEFLLRRTS